jgi:micrococcal nuclease
VIKGNISDNKEKIYHVPGGASYNATVIDPNKGERCFCTEAEAQAAGWRRSLK